MIIMDSGYEGPAIEALGSLFKVTQVFLWLVLTHSLTLPPFYSLSFFIFLALLKIGFTLLPFLVFVGTVTFRFLTQLNNW